MDNKITFIFININSFKSLGYNWLTTTCTSLSCILCRNMIYLLQIGFGQSVRQWYSGIVDSEVTLCDSRSNSDDGNMSIYIHNYSTPMDCCMHPLCIFCCFPFWLLCGGPCYFVSTLSCHIYWLLKAYYIVHILGIQVVTQLKL